MFNMKSLSIYLVILCVAVCADSLADVTAIVSAKNPSPACDLAAREARRYVYTRTGVLLDIRTNTPNAGDAIVVAPESDPMVPDLLGSPTMLGPQEYWLKTVEKSGRKITVATGGSDTAVLYAVYRFAEHLGVRFYLHGDVIPEDRVPLVLPDLDEKRSPLFELRGIQPFHDFPEGPDWWNPDDYMAIIGQLPKLGMNFIGLHTYPEDRPAAEPTVWIGHPEDVKEDGEVKYAYPAIWYNTALPVGWGFQAKKTGDYSLGAANIYDRDGYGSEIMRGLEPTPGTPEECIEVFRRAGDMFKEAFSWAHELGIRTCVGTETPLVVPRKVQERFAQQPPFEALGGKTVSYGEPVEGTDDDTLYQSVRFDLKGYRVPVPNGTYSVVLRFCEIAHNGPGARVFDVLIEGKSVITDLDIFAKVGKNHALDFQFEGVRVEDAVLDIAFAAKTEFPCISAIEVEGDGKSVKINCGGPAYKDFAADSGAASLTKEDIRRLYEGMFTRISRAYPVDYYWFWTPENWTWEGVSEAVVKNTVDDIQTAIEAAKNVNAPFTLATCGWVLGPQYDRAYLDNILPKEMPMSCINRQVGHEPVEPGFSKVTGRPKWAIPWLEDDPAMSSPQLWVGRMRRDAYDALQYGCTGLMGIHWRTRILGPNVSALAQAAWDQSGWSAPEALAEGAIGGSVANYAGVDIADTDKDAVYQTVRYDVNGYRIPVPNGTYKVVLQFCEPHYKEKGKRVFGVKIEGKPVIDKIDVFETAGPNRALDKAFDSVVVTDGVLDIEFTRHVELPCIAAFMVEGPGVSRKINCGGEAVDGYEVDLPQTSPHRPSKDFYLDWAQAEFGPEVAEGAAAILARVDGVLPRPSNWIGGPGGYAPDARPWDVVNKDYAYVEEFAALAPKVTRPGCAERFNYWLCNFRFMRATAQMQCVWNEFNVALDVAKKAGSDDEKKQIAREQALPARIRLVQVVEEAGRNLLQTVSTSGEMGTVTNLEQHTFPGMLETPAKELEGLLGGPLPAEAMPSREYKGAPRVFVPTVRTAVIKGESLTIKAIVLAEDEPKSATLHVRDLGGKEFEAVPFKHVVRGIYETEVQGPSRDFEYYVEISFAAGPPVRWPASAPNVNQTVVVIGGRDRE